MVACRLSSLTADTLIHHILPHLLPPSHRSLLHDTDPHPRLLPMASLDWDALRLLSSTMRSLVDESAAVFPYLRRLLERTPGYDGVHSSDRPPRTTLACVHLYRRLAALRTHGPTARSSLSSDVADEGCLLPVSPVCGRRRAAAPVCAMVAVGDEVVCGSKDGTLSRFDAKTWEPKGTHAPWPLPGEQVTADASMVTDTGPPGFQSRHGPRRCFSLHSLVVVGDEIVSACLCGPAVVWSTRTWQPVAELGDDAAVLSAHNFGMTAMVALPGVVGENPDGGGGGDDGASCEGGGRGGRRGGDGGGCGGGGGSGGSARSGCGGSVSRGGGRGSSGGGSGSARGGSGSASSGGRGGSGRGGGCGEHGGWGVYSGNGDCDEGEGEGEGHGGSGGSGGSAVKPHRAHRIVLGASDGSLHIWTKDRRAGSDSDDACRGVQGEHGGGRDGQGGRGDQRSAGDQHDTCDTCDTTGDTVSGGGGGVWRRRHNASHWRRELTLSCGGSSVTSLAVGRLLHPALDTVFEYVVSGSRDGMVGLWDTHTWRDMAHANPGRHVARASKRAVLSIAALDQTASPRWMTQMEVIARRKWRGGALPRGTIFTSLRNRTVPLYALLPRPLELVDSRGALELSSEAPPLKADHMVGSLVACGGVLLAGSGSAILVSGVPLQDGSGLNMSTYDDNGWASLSQNERCFLVRNAENASFRTILSTVVDRGGHEMGLGPCESRPGEDGPEGGDEGKCDEEDTRRGGRGGGAKLSDQRAARRAAQRAARLQRKKNKRGASVGAVGVVGAAGANGGVHAGAAAGAAAGAVRPHPGNTVSSIMVLGARVFVGCVDGNVRVYEYRTPACAGTGTVEEDGGCVGRGRG